MGPEYHSSPTGIKADVHGKAEIGCAAPIGRNTYFKRSNVIPVSKAVDLGNEYPPHKNGLHPFSTTRGE